MTMRVLQMGSPAGLQEGPLVDVVTGDAVAVEQL